MTVNTQIATQCSYSLITRSQAGGCGEKEHEKEDVGDNLGRMNAVAKQ